MSLSELATLIVAAWVFLVNVTKVSSTVGWIMGLAAVLLIGVPALMRHAR